MYNIMLLNKQLLDKCYIYIYINTTTSEHVVAEINSDRIFLIGSQRNVSSMLLDLELFYLCLIFANMCLL